MAFSASSQKIEAKPVFHNVGGPLRVPGFGYAVEYEAKQHIFHRFYHGVNDFRNKRLLVRELAMLAVMDALTEKPRWHEKMFDEAIVEKWWIEATAMPLISPLAWDWCLRELKDKAQYLAEHGFIKTLETGSVCAKSDNLIDADLRGELLAGVRPLLDVKVKDWHPNSNEQVLNLVHPSLFPLVYGRTQVLHEGLVGLFDCVESCGKGSVAPQYYTEPVANQWGDIMSYEEERTRFSRRFQWLPAEVKFNGAAGTTDVEFTSYINNLHPVQHKKLYSTIAKVVSKAVPMWNEVLVKDYHGRVPPRVRTWVCQGTKSTYNRTHTDLIRSKSFSTIISHLIATQKTKYGIEIVARMPNDCLTKVFREAETQPFKEPAWLDEMPRNEPYGHSSRDSTLLAKVDEFLALPDHPGYSSAGDWDYDRAFIDGRWKNDLSIHMYEAVNWKLVRLRGVLHPEPGDAYTYDEWKAGKSTKVHQKDPYNRMVANLKHEYPKINLETEFRDQGLQVIVKLASVELTPEKPEYDGGSWRLEVSRETIESTMLKSITTDTSNQGMKNERKKALIPTYQRNIPTNKKTRHRRNSNLLLLRRERHRIPPRLPHGSRIGSLRTPIR
jgi:hypothetical protein